MSSHGRSTNARRWARGCGRVSSGSSLTHRLAVVVPHRDHVDVEGARAEPPLRVAHPAGRAAPAPGPGPASRAASARRVLDQHHRVEVRRLVGVAPRRRLVHPGDRPARASPSAVDRARRCATGRRGCCRATAPPGSSRPGSRRRIGDARRRRTRAGSAPAACARSPSPRRTRASARQTASSRSASVSIRLTGSPVDDRDQPLGQLAVVDGVGHVVGLAAAGARSSSRTTSTTKSCPCSRSKS